MPEEEMMIEFRIIIVLLVVTCGLRIYGMIISSPETALLGFLGVGYSFGTLIVMLTPEFYILGFTIGMVSFLLMTIFSIMLAFREKK